MSTTSVATVGNAGDTGVFRSERQRRHAVQLGVWCFLATVTMLFAAFSSAYIVRQSGSDWRATPLPGVLWFNTALLLASGAALELARYEVRRGRSALARNALIATVVMGVSFLIGQFGAWRDLVAAGFYLPTNPHSSFFYVLTGLHAAHLAAGLALLMYLIARVDRSERHGDGDAMPFLLGIGATFWHFFGALWIYLFAMLSWV